MEVYDDNGIVLSDHRSVLNRWVGDYKELYKGYDTNEFDSDFYEYAQAIFDIYIEHKYYTDEVVNNYNREGVEMHSDGKNFQAPPLECVEIFSQPTFKCV